MAIFMSAVSEADYHLGEASGAKYERTDHRSFLDVDVESRRILGSWVGRALVSPHQFSRPR